MDVWVGVGVCGGRERQFCANVGKWGWVSGTLSE